MKKPSTQLLVFILLLLLITSEIISLPRFAVKFGNQCNDCHYNPTGGLIRNLDGWHWGKNLLSMISTKDDEFSMSPKISDNISLGIDYRTQFLYSQQKNRTDFQNMSGSIYTNLALSKNVNVIGKYDFVNLV